MNKKKMNQIDAFHCLTKSEIKLEKLNDFPFSDKLHNSPQNNQQQQQPAKEAAAAEAGEARFDIYSEEYLLSVNEYNHKKIETNSKKTNYKCFICDKKFQSEIDFVEHFTDEEKLLLNDNSHTNKLRCTACSEQFTFRKEFLEHTCELHNS